MNISTSDIENIAKSARLELDESEIKDFSLFLNDITDLINNLDELNVDTVEATIYVSSNQNVFRKDEICESMDRQLILANAPEHYNGCFRVPKIVE